MAEPEQLLQLIAEVVAQKKKSNTLNGRRIIVTAGATIEPIDPVRFISNHSTGKMGYAIAEELAARGADVELISGRTALATPAGVRRTNVVTAEDMYRASVAAFATADAAIMCAAVADYTPAQVAEHKIKKGEGDMSIPLRRTKDIAAELGRTKGSRVLVGFALESRDEMANAQHKLESKNLDFIVLNSLQDPGAGFAVDTNKVSIIDREQCNTLPLMSKREVASDIADRIEKLLNR